MKYLEQLRATFPRTKQETLDAKAEELRWEINRYIARKNNYLIYVKNSIKDLLGSYPVDISTVVRKRIKASNLEREIREAETLYEELF